jgi:hypothetical protein
MAPFKDRRPPRRDHDRRRVERPAPVDDPNRESTGREAAYLKSLVDSGATIVVVLTSGEQLRGHVRYYDRDCFSLGPADGGPRLFLRKSSIRYLYEE